MTDPFVAGLVLAAGGTGRFGRPKPLLPCNGTTMLDHALATAHACEFDQLLVAVGNHAEKVRARVDLTGAGVVPSVAAAMDALDPAATVLVIMRGDQPGVVPATVRVLLAARGDAAIAACRYDDRRGYPLAFGPEAFGELRSMDRDRAVLRMLDRRAGEVEEVPVAGRVPLDVDSWADYEAVVSAVSGQAQSSDISSRRPPAGAGAFWRRRGMRD